MKRWKVGGKENGEDAGRSRLEEYYGGIFAGLKSGRYYGFFRRLFAANAPLFHSVTDMFMAEDLIQHAGSSFIRLVFKQY